MANPERSGGAKLRGPVLNRAGRAAEEVRGVDANVGLRVWALCQKPRHFRVLRPLVPSSAAGERGYTLIEMVMVLTLVAILLAVGASSMRKAVAREEAEGWARSIAYDIAAGRQAALTRRADVAVTTTTTTYTIAANGSGTIRQATLPAGTTMTPVSFGFNRRGVPMLGSAEITSPIDVVVTNSTAGRSYRVRIEVGTGRVSYSEQ